MSSTKRFEHVCDVLQSPFPKQTRMRIAASFVKNHCEATDIINWIMFLLSYQTMMDPNDHNEMLMIPLFLTLDINLRVAIIEMYQQFTNKIPNDILEQWTNLTQNHLLSTDIYKHNIWDKQNDSNDVEQDIVMLTNDNDAMAEQKEEEPQNDKQDKKEAGNEEDQDNVLDEELFSKFICDEVMMIISKINAMDKSDAGNCDEIWTMFKTKTCLMSIPFALNLNIMDILNKNALFYQYYVDKFILQNLINVKNPNDETSPYHGYKSVSIEQLKSFMFWLLLSPNHAHNSINDFLWLYLWIFIPIIVINSKSREFRDIIYYLVENNQSMLDPLWPYLIGLCFVCEEMQQFMKLMVMNNGRKFNNALLQNLIKLFCDLSENWNDKIYELLFIINTKIKEMSMECYQLLISKIEYNLHDITISDKYVRFILELIKKNKNHSKIYKQRLTDIVENIATNSSIRVNALQKFIDRL